MTLNMTFNNHENMTYKNQPKLSLLQACHSRWLPFLIAVFLFSTTSIAYSQIDQADGSKSAAEVAETPEQLKQQFDDAVSDLRTAVKQVRRTSVIYFESDSSMSMALKQKWDEEAAIAKATFGRVRDLAFKYFLISSKPDPEIMRIVMLLNPKLIEEGQLTTCYAATRKLLELNPADPELITLMGRISILVNDFKTSAEYFPTHKTEVEEFELPERAIYSYLDELVEKFDRELKFREEEAKADDLPHAIIETPKGQIVIELFEDQAPETVNNFVSLVEAGFYDGMIFHHVLRNILANSGKMSMNRALPLGYSIYDEAGKPDARHHFRGSVSMYLKSDEPNVGGAEFQIMKIPAPNMDGKNTVFGRVISDMRVIDSLAVTFQINEEGKEEFVEGAIPDTITSITVKRLRPHEYVPNPVKEK